MAPATALIFPGQGSQRVGLLDAVPPVECFDRLLDAAEALSGMELRRIAAAGPDEALADTRVAQPLLYLSGWAWGRALLDAGVTPVAVAGHSLGEFAALATAGVYSVEAGLELVCERARLMASLAPAGTMAAVLGMDRATVLSLTDELDGVWIANDNGQGQIVLSGTHEGLEIAVAALGAAGARRVVPLDVAGPFHSPLMERAREAFAAVLNGAAFSDARIPVIQNTEPTPATDARLIKDRLADQITSPVRWTETMAALAAIGASVLVEAGPGGVLTGLARRVPDFTAIAAEYGGVAGVLEVVA